MIHDQSVSSDTVFIFVSVALLPELGSEAFALKMLDESMTPEFRVNDVLVIDPSITPTPGDYVLVHIAGKQEAIICRYRKLSYTSPEFELVTLNDSWPNIKMTDEFRIEIIGKVMQKIHVY